MSECQTSLSISIMDAQNTRRLAAIRLECLKLAQSTDDGPSCVGGAKATTQRHVEAAREMFDFVTDAPRAPEPLKLFVVRRTMEITGKDPEATHLSISGDLAYWTIERGAFRFAAEAEAKRAVEKFGVGLYGFGVIPAFVVEQLPDGTELF